LQYRKRVIAGYPSLFGEASEEGSGHTREEQFASKYGWFTSLYSLSGGQAVNYQKVTKMNHLEALMFLEFEKEKAEIEASQRRRNR